MGGDWERPGANMMPLDGSLPLGESALTRALGSKSDDPIVPGGEAHSRSSESEDAWAIRQAMPSEGLFAGHEWRISPAPLRLGLELAKELDSLGRVLLQFYRAVNLLY